MNQLLKTVLVTYCEKVKLYKYFLQAGTSEIILQIFKTFLNICKYIFSSLILVYVKKDVQKLYKVLIMLKYFFLLE